MSKLQLKPSVSSVKGQQKNTVSAMSRLLSSNKTPSSSKKQHNSTQRAVANRAATKVAKSASARVPSNISFATGRPVNNGKAGTAKFSKKGADINGADRMEKRLQKRSPWYMSLIDPVQGAGARIPDLVGINTATFQSVQNITVATNAQGMNGLYLSSPYPCNSGSVNNIFPIASASTPAAVAWATASVNGATKLAAQDTLFSIAQSVRVVSAAIFAEYEGSTLNDTGETTCFVNPYENKSPVTLYSSYQIMYGATSIPVNKARTQPLVARWFPCSYNTWEYSDFQDLDNTEWSNKPTSGSTNYSPFWGMGFISQGLTNAPSVKYTIVVNYEFIPRYNTLDYIAASPSPIDPIEEQLVEQWVQSDTQTGISSNKLVDVQPGAQKVDEASQGMSASNMFGMLGDILVEVAPMLLAL